MHFFLIAKIMTDNQIKCLENKAKLRMSFRNYFNFALSLLFNYILFSNISSEVGPMLALIAPSPLPINFNNKYNNIESSL
jgi:hypothetical protein